MIRVIISNLIQEKAYGDLLKLPLKSYLKRVCMEKPLSIDNYVEKLNDQAKSMFSQLRTLFFDIDKDMCETLFVSHPFYYLKQYESIKPHSRPSIMCVYYQDHVNIFASEIHMHTSTLTMYKITEKHTLQLYYDQPFMKDILMKVFKDSIHA